MTPWAWFKRKRNARRAAVVNRAASQLGRGYNYYVNNANYPTPLNTQGGYGYVTPTPIAPTFTAAAIQRAQQRAAKPLRRQNAMPRARPAPQPLDQQTLSNMWDRQFSIPGGYQAPPSQRQRKVPTREQQLKLLQELQNDEPRRDAERAVMFRGLQSYKPKPVAPTAFNDFIRTYRPRSSRR